MLCNIRAHLSEACDVEIESERTSTRTTSRAFFLHDTIAPTPKGVEPIVLLSCNPLGLVLVARFAREREAPRVGPPMLVVYDTKALLSSKGGLGSHAVGVTVNLLFRFREVALSFVTWV